MEIRTEGLLARLPTRSLVVIALHTRHLFGIWFFGMVPFLSHRRALFARYFGHQARIWCFGVYFFPARCAGGGAEPQGRRVI